MRLDLAYAYAHICVLSLVGLLCQATGEVNPPVVDRATLALLRCDKQVKVEEGPLHQKVRARNVTLVPGRFGLAYNCAAGGSIDVRLKEDANPVDAFTIECWAKLEDIEDRRLQRLVGRQ